MILILSALQGADIPDEENLWLKQFANRPIPVCSEGVCEALAGPLPSFTVFPPRSGKFLVRVSLPFAPGTMPADLGVQVTNEGNTITPGFRPLTFHPGKPKSVRRGLVTFVYDFPDSSPRTFQTQWVDCREDKSFFTWKEPQPEDPTLITSFHDIVFSVNRHFVDIQYPDGTKWHATFLSPKTSSDTCPIAECVEINPFYLWFRLLCPDRTWPRILEVRADVLGRVVVQGHVQRREPDHGFAPDLGWEITGNLLEDLAPHSFKEGESKSIQTSDGKYVFDFPMAPYLRRGNVLVSKENQTGTLCYLRCTAEEKVPFQSMAWRNAAVVIRPEGTPDLSQFLTPNMPISIAPEYFARAYHLPKLPDLSAYPILDDITNATERALAHSVCLGDDYGNVTMYTAGAPASYYGMNRLNHAPAMFENAWLGMMPTWRDIAVLWCSNMYDLSLWWGNDEGFGGTRYNNVTAWGKPVPETDMPFLWRSNEASSFCTKGFVSFLYAYEETGDPRMAVALDAQVHYASRFIHADKGECRNIGDVIDFVELYRLTRVENFKDQALRLFRELKTKLSDDNLFDQSGKPIEKDLPFIDDDNIGLKHGFAKPYIIGYALSGLPSLLRLCPQEPQLRDAVRSIAQFLASSQDPLGGWRYPHPKSSTLIMVQAIEHASQIARAAAVLEDQGEPIEDYLDAIERTLRIRLKTFEKTADFLYGLTGWEKNPGALPEGKTIYDLYQKMEERVPDRDYEEGAITIGVSPPEGLVYWGEVLRFYLAHRPAERLFSLNGVQEKVLKRIEDRRPKLKAAVEDQSILGIYTSDALEFLFGMSAPRVVENTPSESIENPAWQMAENGTACVKHTFPTFEAVSTWKSLPSVLDGQIEIVPTSESFEQIPISIEYEIKTESLQPSTETSDSSTDYPMFVTGANGKWCLALTADKAWQLTKNEKSVTIKFQMQSLKYSPSIVRMRLQLYPADKPPEKDPFRKVWNRWSTTAPAPSPCVTNLLGFGMRDKLPVFTKSRLQEMDFREAFSRSSLAFPEWRSKARETFLESLGPDLPRVPFEPTLLDSEDRGTYEARKIALNLSAYERVKAYLLIPKTNIPCPAVLALHDHGAHFSIGKEKVIRPFNEPDSVQEDARAWVEKYYAGRWIGDELARRGYVVLATDALYWGDRGRKEGPEYETQQELAANLFQLGLTWAGIIIYDDIRSAQFLQGLPEVDPNRIGCIGLSLGAHRTWNLCAATDIVKVGAAICWMGDTLSLMAEGSNQTRGQSAFTMILPGLRNALDYPDVASIACPKPMLFFNGYQDTLFPVDGVERAYKRMQNVWESAGASDRLVTKLWDVPHEFSGPMQEETFSWLDTWLKNQRR